MNPRGAQRQAIMLAREWRAMGHDAHVFTGEKASPYAFDPLLEDVPMHVTGSWFVHIRRGGTLPGSNAVRTAYSRRRLVELGRRVESERFDVVNAHNHPAQWIASGLARTPVAWTCNEPPHWHYRPSLRNRLRDPLAKVVDKANARRLAKILVLDERMAAVTRRAYPDVDVRVTGSGCELPGPLPPEDEGRRLAGTDAGGFHVVSVLGGIAPQKRPRDALDALVESGVPRATLHLVGGDTEGLVAGLRERAAKAGVGLSWRASVPERELLALYATCDAAVFVPENQPWGIFPLEALLAGVPTVLSDETGALEALPPGGKYPYVAPVGDARAAGAHLRAIHEDRQAARREADRAGAHLRENYSWRACARRVLDAMRDAMA